MCVWASKSAFQQRFKAPLQAILAVAALLVFGLLPRTGRCASFGIGEGLKPTAEPALGFAPAYKLGPFIERRELHRNHGYARVVWLPESASTQVAGQRVSFGLASLNSVFRRAMRDGDNARGPSVVPVMWVPMFHNTSMTLIPNLGGSTKAMVAFQFQLGH